MKISINSLNYVSIRSLAEMGLCCWSILWRWCQKKRVKDSETGTVILVLCRDTQGAKWLKGFCKESPKNLSGWEQSPDIFGLFRAQLQAVCPWHQSGKAFLLYFCSSQKENSLFHSLEPLHNRWKCLTTATTQTAPHPSPSIITPSTAPSQSPLQEKAALHPPCDLGVFRRPGIAEEGLGTGSVLILPLNVSCNWIRAGNFLSSL